MEFENEGKLSFAFKLWSGCDLLHERFRKRYDNCNNLIDLLTKVGQAAREYSKSLSNILAKNYSIFLETEKDSTISKALEHINFDLTEQTAEFKNIGKDVKNECLNNFTKVLNEYYSKEKEKYNDFKKAISNYKSAKKDAEKAKGNFLASATTAEKLIISSKTMELDKITSNSSEKDKAIQKSASHLTEAYNLEKTYITKLEEANKCREEVIQLERDLLDFYESLETNINKKQKEMYGFYIFQFKKAFCVVSSDLDLMNKFSDEIDFDFDTQNFIKENQINGLPEPEIKFSAYQPSITVDDTDMFSVDLYCEVLSELKSKLTDVAPSFNLENEKRKMKIRQLSKNVFLLNKEFKEEDLKELLACVENPVDRNTFLYTLNQQRTTGKYSRSPKVMETLQIMLNRILEIAENEKDYDSARNCVILSQTFYKLEGEQKVYLLESIRNNKWLQTIEFWENIIELMIKFEMRKNEHINKEINERENQEQTKKRIGNIAFSQLLPYSNNMIEFKIELNKILEVVEKIAKSYNIEKETIDMMLENIKSIYNSKNPPVEDN